MQYFNIPQHPVWADHKIFVLLIFIIHTLLQYYYIRIIIAGGNYYDVADNSYELDDILEFDQVENAIVPLGHMTEARSQHAISVVKIKDYAQWCH